jgi:hypothetical protein
MTIYDKSILAKQIFINLVAKNGLHLYDSGSDEKLFNIGLKQQKTLLDRDVQLAFAAADAFLSAQEELEK